MNTPSHVESAGRSIEPAGAAVGRRSSARALRLGSRLKLVDLELEVSIQSKTLAKSPPLLQLRGGGFAALFTYGTVVLIEVSRAEEEALLQTLGDRIEGRLDTPFESRSEIETGTSLGVSGDLIKVRSLSPSSLTVIADALAKNVALSFEEAEVGRVLEMIEPFSDDLADNGRLPRNRRRMLRAIGQALQIHHRLIERVEVEEKLDLPTDDEEVNHLHKALADAYHLRKRAKSLSHKLEVIEVMTTALAELVDAQRETRIELLIVLLIAVEIAIWLYELVFERG